MKRKSNDTPTWPVGDDGQKVKAAQLLFAENPMELDIKQALLHAYGIPTVANAPNQGFFSGVLFGSPIIGATLYVPETRLEEAKELVEAEVVEEDVSE